MRHLKRGRKLNRTSSHRKAMRKNMVVALLTHGRIITTLPKAKEMRSPAEKLITLAKHGVAAKARGDDPHHLHCYRRAISALGGDKVIAKKLFEEIAPGYTERSGGYTRVLRDEKNRLGDNAPRAIFELVEFTPVAQEEEPVGRKKKKKKG